MRVSKMTLRAMVPLAAATAVLFGVAGAGVGAAAEPAQTVDRTSPVTRDTAKVVTGTTERLAKELALSLGAKGAEARARQAVSGDKGEVDLIAFSRETKGLERFHQLAVSGNTEVQRAKGLKAGVGSLLELRLGDRSMREDIQRGAGFLVAGEADEDATTINAYDGEGRVHVLDARTTPDRAVLVVGINSGRTLKAGLEQMRSALNEQGIKSQLPGEAAEQGQAGRAGVSAGYDATLLENVYLKDDLEPWHKGAAEIYALVAGVNPQGQPQVDTVQMPYLDWDKQMYAPHQILVNWSHFKFNAADMVMMEEDTGANYADLTAAVAKALLKIIKQDEYVPLVDEVIKAIPQAWFTDDHDYVDSLYTLQKNASGARSGVARNGVYELRPFHVDGL
ncbi:DUF3103 family protein [Streptomyces sp. NPDC055607]